MVTGPDESRTRKEVTAMIGQVITRWGPHIELKGPAILVRRSAVSEGDVVHSSHLGRVTVHSVRIIGITAYLRFTEHGHPEAYDADSEIPSYTAYEAARAEQQELLETAGLSKTLRLHAAGQEEALAWALEQIREAYSLNAVAHVIGDRLRTLQRKAAR